MMLRLVIGLAAAVALAGCGERATQGAPPVKTATVAPAETAPDLPAGAYKLDPTHASLLFRVDHLGFSKYTARFTDWDAQLQLDPANPAAAQLTAEVKTRSLSLERPPAGFEDTLRGPNWLDAGKYPTITFKSTAVTPTGPRTATITGDLTLHGVTKPVTLNATFNGGYKGHPMDPNARIGFSATGSFKRSDFGVAYGVPAPGTTMGVSDAVDVVIEAEFTGPALKVAPAAGSVAAPAAE
jgi:polyisoprenoid-binding protein YceI